jgi:hypothetical protein
MNRHIVRAGLTAAAAIAGAAGCQTKPPQGAQSGPPQPLAQETQPAPKPAPTPAAMGAAEALTFKFENWSREIEPFMSKRVRKAAADPSDVDFLDPSDFRLGPVFQPSSKKLEPPIQVIPIANTITSSTPSIPNQSANLASAEKPRGNSGANGPGFLADSPPERGPITTAKDASPSAGDLELTLTRNLRDYPRDLWAHLDYQMLQFLKDKPTPQLDALARLATEERELIAAIMDGLTNFRNGIRADNNMLTSRKVRPLLDLADRLRAQAELVIPTLALCTKVEGFGVYEPFEPARFTAMKEHRIIVYCEVENFASHLNGKKFWETKLSQEVVLYTESGLPVWQDKTENIADLARNRRHDFFVIKKTSFPPNITIGRYLLKVTIVDQQASRVAEQTVPVLFVAQ